MTIRIALVCEYVAKRPADRERVLHLFKDVFGMDTYSYLRGYARERSVIESLAARARGGEIALFGGLFLDLAESYLHTEFNQTKADGRHAIMMYTFAVPLTPELKEFRKSIWRTAFTFFDDVRYQGAVLRMLSEQGRGTHMFSGGETICADAPTLLELFIRRLDPSHYPHCATVQKYRTLLTSMAWNYDAPR